MEQLFLQSIMKLASVAVFIQMIEYWWLRFIFSDKGIWKTSDLKKNNWVVSYSLTQVALVLGIASSFLLFFIPVFSIPTLLVVLILTFRMRGPFNGGSDSMSAVVLVGLSIWSLAPQNPWVQKFSLLYIGLHSLASYFIAGLVKARVPQWWSGEALTAIVLKSSYNIPNRFQKWVEMNPKKTRALGWIVLLFELLFPLALLSPKSAALFILAAGVFHLLNAYILGLNRFLFIWVSTYPALYYCSWFLKALVAAS